MAQRIYSVDAFTDRPFGGNPATVCLLSDAQDDRWMQLVASEMNLSETAFLRPGEDGFSLRWFTPAVEVELCGHATLASAHILWETGVLGPDEQARFHTLSGLLTAQRNGDLIEMDFPAEPAAPVEAPPDLLEGLGTEALWVGQNRMDYLVEVASEETVQALQPDLSRLAQVTTRGVIVTARADARPYDFVSRFFCPAVGIPEDPVTGSAHCALGPFWGERLGKTELAGYQASARGGEVWVRLQGDRVVLAGRAVTTLRADLLA